MIIKREDIKFKKVYDYSGLRGKLERYNKAESTIDEGIVKVILEPTQWNYKNVLNYSDSDRIEISINIERANSTNSYKYYKIMADMRVVRKYPKFHVENGKFVEEATIDYYGLLNTYKPSVKVSSSKIESVIKQIVDNINNKQYIKDI